MMNTGPDPADAAASQEKAVEDIVRTGSRGAIAVAGIATAIVVALWFAFYLLVFMPRATAP